MTRSIRRALVAAVLVVALSAAGPGAVGDCGATTQPASAGEYCQSRLLAFCYRQEAEGLAVDPNCTDPARYCASQSPFTTCIPTDLQAEACVEAIYDLTRPYDTLMSLPECDFCGAM